MKWKTLRENIRLEFNDIELDGRINYDPSQHALIFVDPTTGEDEVLTVDLLSSGYLARPGEVFVKDWSEHTGLGAALATHGIAEIVESVRVGPFGLAAYRMRVIEHESAY